MPGSISNASTYYGSNAARGKAILMEHGTVTNGVATLRTVTAGKTYFLMSCTLYYYSSATNDQSKLYVDLTGNLLLAMRSRITAGTWDFDSDHAELTFPHPVPIQAGSLIKVSSSTATCLTGASIVGWEE